MANIDLSNVVTALQSSITGSDIVTFFATGVTVALPIILTWFGCRWVKTVAHLKVCERFANGVQNLFCANGETFKMAIPC